MNRCGVRPRTSTSRRISVDVRAAERAEREVDERAAGRVGQQRLAARTSASVSRTLESRRCQCRVERPAIGVVERLRVDVQVELRATRG